MPPVIHERSIEVAGRTLTIETGRVAEQADGAVLVRYGETVVLTTVVGAKQPVEGIDFFPSRWNTKRKCTRQENPWWVFPS